MSKVNGFFLKIFFFIYEYQFRRQIFVKNIIFYLQFLNPFIFKNHAQFLMNRHSSIDSFKLFSFEYVDSWPKILLFRNHHRPSLNFHNRTDIYCSYSAQKYVYYMVKSKINRYLLCIPKPLILMKKEPFGQYDLNCGV